MGEVVEEDFWRLLLVSTMHDGELYKLGISTMWTWAAMHSNTISRKAVKIIMFKRLL